ncbi:MAG: hypothetical protein ABL921_22550 [Pirellula sp.]
MSVNYWKISVHCAVGTLLLLSTAPTLYAQRYLTEFVGTSNVRGTTGSFALPSNLAFDVLDGQRVAGDFAFMETSQTGLVEVEAFSAVAVVTQNGRCIAQLDANRTGGSLRLFEANFDANVFALVGSVEFERDPGSVSLSTGRLKGFGGYLQPVIGPIKIPLGLGTALRQSAVTGKSSEHPWIVGETREFGTAVGFFDTYEIVLSASPKWLYIVGVSEGIFFTSRAAVILDSKGNMIGAKGDYIEQDSNRKILDTGTIAISLGVN